MAEINKKKVAKILDTLTEAIEHIIIHDNPTWLELYSAIKFCEDFHNTDPVLERAPVSDSDKAEAIKVAQELSEFCRKTAGKLPGVGDDSPQAIDEDKYRN